MNPFNLEKKLNNYKSLIGNNNYSLSAFKFLIDFYTELTQEKNEMLHEIYLSETLPHLINHSRRYSAYGQTPTFTENILNTINKLFVNVKNDLTFELFTQLDRIEREKSELQGILNGISKSISEEFNISFPVIEKESSDNENYGLVETLSISINLCRGKNENIFNIIPSMPTIEEKLKQQIDDSWEFAVNYLSSKFSKRIPPLEVIIKFDNRFGFYEGDSLGVALTIGFIEELFAFFDIREKLLFSTDIIATGSVEKNGNIAAVSKTIIETKSITAFYSNANIFILPISDYPHSMKVIKEQLNYYPERKLDLIPISNIKDAINRRDLLVIKKQNLFSWSTKKILKNKLALSFLVVLFAIFFTFFYLYQDNNPHHVDAGSESFLIKNKSGVILWEKKTKKNLNSYSRHFIDPYHQIYDINEDGTNEVLLSLEKFYLFDNAGNEIWNYECDIDTLKSDRETFKPNFSAAKIFGVFESSLETKVIVSFNHNPYYPSLILQLDLLTGKRIGNYFIHAGRINFGKIIDLDKDGKMEILAACSNNGLNRAVLFSLDIEKISGQSPKVNNYTFHNKSVADFNDYILLPKPDLFSMEFSKYFVPYSLNIGDNFIDVTISKSNVKIATNNVVNSRFNPDLLLNQIIIPDEYSNKRDKLVKSGELDYPLSDTDEYREILMNQIEYWDGEKFVKFKQPD